MKSETMFAANASGIGLSSFINNSYFQSLLISLTYSIPKEWDVTVKICG